MSETVAAAPPVKRQRLGRRLGAEPYYRIAEHTPQRLTLDSRPELNWPVARNFLFLSVLFGLPALVALCGGIILVGQVGLPAMLLVILGLLLGSLALITNTMGRALRRIRNQIVVDGEARKLVYRQYLAGRPAKTQTLPFEQILGLQIVEREAKLFPAFLGRTRQLQIIELCLAGNAGWLVDSAATAEALRPTAEALRGALGLQADT
jgi:hypothetical protein